MMRRAVEYWERRQELADRCACGGSPMYRKALTSDSLSTHGFFGQKLPITPSTSRPSEAGFRASLFRPTRRARTSSRWWGRRRPVVSDTVG